MTLTGMIIAGLAIALIAGWAIGVVASNAAEGALHIPRTSLLKFIPLAAALALAGGLTVGAWQASERLLTDEGFEQADSSCAATTQCSPCGTCPSK